jgi:hypothetical protein
MVFRKGEVEDLWKFLYQFQLQQLERVLVSQPELPDYQLVVD